MESTFQGRRNSVIKSLQENRDEIAMLNADIDRRIAEHKKEIQSLKQLQKALKKTKMSCHWLLDLLIRLFK